jgi:hypothetical protein
MDYVVRVFAYAGESHLRVEHSFVQHDDIISVDLDSLVLRMETPVQSAVLEGTEVATAAGEATLTASLASEGSSVCDRPWTVAQNGATISEGVVADGRLIARGPGQMVVDIYDFARNAPKTFTVTPDRVDIGIVGGPFSFYKGMMKTHEMVIAFGDDGETVADAFDAAGAAARRRQRWYCDSRATGHRPLGPIATEQLSPATPPAIDDHHPRLAQHGSATGDSTRSSQRGHAPLRRCRWATEGGNNLESALERRGDDPVPAHRSHRLLRLRRHLDPPLLRHRHRPLRLQRRADLRPPPPHPRHHRPGRRRDQRALVV